MSTRNAKSWLPIVALLAVTQVQAESLVEGSIEAGKAKSITCSACHGLEGISVMGHVYRDPALVATEVRALEKWIGRPSSATFS